MLKTIARSALNAIGYDIRRIPQPTPPPPVPQSVYLLIERLWPVSVDFPLIRVGGETDGAYLIPDDLDGIAALFSPGVDRVAAFEAEIAARGIPCYLADASVAGPPVANDAFHFEAKFLGLRDTDLYSTIDAWVDRHAPGTSDLLMQIDIEGAEWTVLPNMSDALLNRCRIMVVEFHALTQLLLNEYVRPHMIETLDRLLATHHVVHNHPNNYGALLERHGVAVPDVIELTFLRKDRAVPTDYARTFPHALDIMNGAHVAAMPLPANWYAPPGATPSD